jgi:hypothetical protein
MKRLAVALLVFVTGVVGFDISFGVYAKRHFLPHQKLLAAIAAGDRCLVYTGDSRMVAATDAPALTKALSERVPCVTDLSLGGTTIVEQALALREYLDAGRRPAYVLVGYSGDALLQHGSPPLDDLAGNRAAALLWSQSHDVLALYPGFPRAHLDEGLRFSVRRATYSGSLISLIWGKLHPLQDRVAGVSEGARNRFGRIDAMQDLGEKFRLQARQTFAALEARGAPSEFDPFFEEILDRAHSMGVPVLVAEVPMQAGYRSVLRDMPSYLRMKSRLQRRLEQVGGALLVVDLDGFDDSAFEDGLHVGEAGAERYTRALASSMNGLLARDSVVRVQSTTP